MYISYPICNTSVFCTGGYAAPSEDAPVYSGGAGAGAGALGEYQADAGAGGGNAPALIKKKIKFSSNIKKFRMEQGKVIYEEGLCKYFPIYEEAVSHI
jgi:hypothetical protein